MLSTAAWNAFLKTLEEPPQHVVFVLATTEAHKVPATIVDRCHRFDFQRPSLEQIAGVLRRVASEEGITIPDPALGMISRKAGGSFRDALGTLEQLVTYGGTEVALDDVLDNLGVADAGLILDSAEALIEKSPRDALLTVQKLADSGRDYEQFMRDLAAHLRHLLVVKTVGEVPDSFAVTAEHTDRLASQAERLSQGDLLRAIDLLAAAIAAVREGSEPRLALEVALLKATQPQADQSLQALMFRIDQLEARLGASAAAPAAGGAAHGGSTPAADGEPVTARSSEAEADAAAAADAPHASGGGGGSSPGSVIAQPVRAAVNAVAGAAAAVAEVARPQTEEEPAPAIDLERVRALWSSVAEAVREQNAMVGALIAEAVPSALEDDRLTISFPPDAAFLKRKAEANRELLLSALRSFTGRGLAVAFELSDQAAEQRAPRTLGEEELLERLKRDFGAEEVFDDPEPDPKG